MTRSLWSHFEYQLHSTLAATPLFCPNNAETLVTPRAKYRMGRTLGAGTYGIVREADCPDGKVAVKIILKKNVKGNEQMVYDELQMLQNMHHSHIVRFHDWFESKVGFCLVSALHLEADGLVRTNTTLSRS